MLSNTFIEFSVFHALCGSEFLSKQCPSHTERKERHSGQNLFYPFLNIVYLGSFST